MADEEKPAVSKASERAIDRAAEADLKAREQAEHDAAKAELVADATTAKVAEEKAKQDAADAAKAEKAEKSGETAHAKGLGLESGKRHTVVGSNPNQKLTGRLVRTSDLGVLLTPDGEKRHSFLPWHNVFAVHPEPED